MQEDICRIVKSEKVADFRFHIMVGFFLWIWPTHLTQIVNIETIITKGQTKKKRFFQADVSSKKTNKRILLYYYETSSRLVFIRFLEEIENTKKIFRN
jgi:hypothetical protein